MGPGNYPVPLYIYYLNSIYIYICLRIPFRVSISILLVWYGDVVVCFIDIRYENLHIFQRFNRRIYWDAPKVARELLSKLPAEKFDGETGRDGFFPW